MIVICRGNYPVEVMPAGTTRAEALTRATEMKTEYCTNTKTAPERVPYTIHVVPLTGEPQ